jgi:hypothetical protein
MTMGMSITSLLPIAGAAAGVVAACASSAASGATEAFANLFAEKPQTHSLDEPPKLPSPSEAEAMLAQVKDRLYARLREMGIALQQPVKLAVDAFGKVRETSGNPQGPAIEEVLASDDALANTFRQAAAQMELMRAAKEHQQFAELYAQNPELAVAQYSHLFDNRDPPRFVLQLSGDLVEPLFEPA